MSGHDCGDGIQLDHTEIKDLQITREGGEVVLRQEHGHHQHPSIVYLGDPDALQAVITACRYAIAHLRAKSLKEQLAGALAARKEAE